jgi:brefeldin A-inhibited guanine nucleotide-exchange protein
MSDKKVFTDSQKFEKLYTIYSFAFDKFNKYSSKKDNNMQLIKEINSSLKNSPKNFNDPNNIKKYSLLLVEPFDKCSTKIMEVILSSMEEILKYNLVEPNILQKMVEKLIAYIHKYFQFNEIDFKVDSKILKICELIYLNQNIFIHNENLKSIIKIYLRIFLSSHNTESFQNQTQRTLFVLIHKMIDKLAQCNIVNKDFGDFNILAGNKEDSEQRKEMFYRLQLNEFNFISKKYTDFLIDLIEIQSQLNEKENNENKCDIINKYISIIQSSSDNQKCSLIKEQLESLKLNELNLEYNDISNNKTYVIGKYGWCILCRKTANFWSEKLNFPVCCTSGNCRNNNFNCDLEFQKCLSNLYPRSDFLNMLIYLTTTTSTLGNTEEDNSEVKILCRQFCLINIKEMIEKSNNYFQNDNDIIFIIKELFKDSLLKNALSNKIKIFKLSLEVFVSVIKCFRAHLKEQIEIFMMKVLVKFLESEIFDFEYKKAILDALLLLVDDVEFLVEIYVNYDCDVNCNAVFSVLINLLTKIINGLYKKSKYQNTFKNQEENQLVEKTLTFLNKFVFNLNTLVERNERQSKAKQISGSSNIYMNNNAQDENENTVGVNGSLNNTTTVTNNIDEYSSSNNNLVDVKDKINKNLQIKKMLEKAIEIFNIGKSSSECFKFLQKEKMIFTEQSFSKIKSTYIDDINNNTIQNDYSKLLSPEEHTIISEMSTEEVSFDIYKNTNLMQTPFLSTINPLVYFIIKEDKEKLPTLTFDDYSAFEMARFIRTNLKKLNREKVGDYLCSGKPFNIKVLTYFINSFDFSNHNILDAMRVLFYELPLSGEAQVIDRVVQTFGEKFHRQNPHELKNPDYCYYLAFSLLQLNTDLHRDEVENKMTLKQFINALNLSTGNDKIDPKYLENLYNKIATDPLVIPGQKLSGSTKNKKELLEEEKNNIMESTLYQLRTITKTNIVYNYLTGIDNDNIRNLLEFSWSNFFSIYSQLLAEGTDERNIQIYIENILLMARISGILKLNTAAEAYINTIITMTNINDNREIGIKNLLAIQALVNFIINSGQYIRTGWLIILEIISKIEYYLNTDKEYIRDDLKKHPTMKNIEKEININFQKKEIISKNISDVVCDGIFSKTDKFDEDSIIDFVTSLCMVSKKELTEYYHRRVFSLIKLSEVADFNIYRIQVQWVKIWKLIGDHFVYVISQLQQQNIWQNALDNLKQIIGKLLQKQDLSIYNFQMDFFKPFEIIFKQTKGFPERGQFVISYIYFIVGQYGRNIHSGWIVIFRILKEGFQRNDPKINGDIQATLQKIYEESLIINDTNIEVFKGYIETLCYMYLDKSLKQYAFETILNLLAKIMKEMDDMNEEDEKDPKKVKKNNKVPILKLPGINKKYDFLQIFFYGFDDLIHINVIEHLNLLFEIISHNKKIIFSKDCHSFLYMYYSYFKPHLVILLLSKYINRFSLFENIPNLENYTKYDDNNTLEAKIENIRLNLKDSLSSLINDFNSENGIEYDKIFYEKEKKAEHKKALVGFLREIKEGYNKEDMTLIIKKKLTEISNIEERNYELAIDVFLEKFKNMYSSLKENEQYLKYNYFYEDLFLTVHKLLIINNNSDLLIRILNKILSTDDNIDINKKGTISQKCISKINEGNLFILNLISNAKIKTNEEKLHKLVGFSSSYSNFVLSFIQHYESDIEKEFKLLSKIFCKILQIDLENSFERYKIVSSSSTVDMLIRFQGIQSTILSKIKNDEYEKLYSDDTSINKLMLLNKIYDKYNLFNQENKPMINILQFELEKTLPKFMKCFNVNELKEIFCVLTNLIDSNDVNLRKSVKNLLKEYINLNLVIFNK